MKNSNNRTAEGIAFLLMLPIGLYFETTRAFAIIILVLLGLLFLAMYISADNSNRKLQVQTAEVKKTLAAARTKARSKVRRIVKHHIESLARHRIALVRVDHYGVADGSAWNREVQHFVDKVVRPELTEEEAFSLTENNQFSTIFQELIEDAVRLRAEEIEESLTFSDTMSPHEFEKWCANELEKLGWKCITTQATGDQGADVVAEKKLGKTETIRIVLQCKLWSSAVGNKAVQEAHAAKAHYIASHAAVVTNAKFTASAKQLAQSTNVFLWHFSDLERIDKLLSRSKR